MSKEKFDLLFSLLKSEDTWQEEEGIVCHLYASLPFLESSPQYRNLLAETVFESAGLAASLFSNHGSDRKAIALLEDTLSNYSTFQELPRSLQVHNQLGVAYGQEGDFRKAEMRLESAFERKRRSMDPSTPLLFMYWATWSMLISMAEQSIPQPLCLKKSWIPIL